MSDKQEQLAVRYADWLCKWGWGRGDTPGLCCGVILWALNCARGPTERRCIRGCYATACLRPKTGRNAFAVPQPRRPESRTTPLEVARLVVCHAIQGAATNTGLGHKELSMETMLEVVEHRMRLPSVLDDG